ncbi:MAG: FMN-binding protein [Bacteroidales bacterium]|nr:FMN-binding protein [Bacteroidales bacterium]
MNVQNNSYTFLYSSVLVIIVATLLALAATALKPAQERNVEIEKKQNILSSVRISSTRENVQQLYDQYISDSYTLNSKGEKTEGVDPFTVNLREELKKPREKRNLPVFECTVHDSLFMVIPVYGKGLWGPIWGYISLVKDKSSRTDSAIFIPYRKIYGAIFDHKGETPGLGAEINQPFFQLPFRDKTIFNDQGQFISINVVKGGADLSSLNEVDAISGGTITSKGVQAMLDTCLTSYQTYFKSYNK